MAGPVFLDYDQMGLDAQYNLRDRWPEHPEYFRRWADESAALRETRGGKLDLAYGPSAGQMLDLFVPETNGLAPLLGFIHGGYWQALDKGDFSYLAAPFLDAGIAFASLNYDLAPAAGIGEMVEQIRRAFAWLYREGADLGLDRDRLFVAGHSAGGHLTAMALATDWPGQAGADLPVDLVKGGCSVSGVYDLEPIRRSYHQTILSIDEATVAQANPMTAPPSAGMPLILAVGSEETEEFHRQQHEFEELCGRAAVGLEVVGLPGRNHFTAIDAMAEADHALFHAVRELVAGS